MFLAGFMAVLNITITYLALPSIERALHAGIADQQWILSIYPLWKAASPSPAERSATWWGASG